MTTCYKCRKEIIFDDNIRSASGKKIPLDPDTERPHECSSDFTDSYTLANDIVSLDQKEQEQIKRMKYD